MIVNLTVTTDNLRSLKELLVLLRQDLDAGMVRDNYKLIFNEKLAAQIFITSTEPPTNLSKTLQRFLMDNLQDDVDVTLGEAREWINEQPKEEFIDLYLNDDLINNESDARNDVIKELDQLVRIYGFAFSVNKIDLKWN